MKGVVLYVQKLDEIRAGLVFNTNSVPCWNTKEKNCILCKKKDISEFTYVG